MTIDDHALAHELVSTAGRYLVNLRDGSRSSTADELRDEGDHGSHQLLVEELMEHRPGDSIVSEHGTAGTPREPGSRVWIVDPLDGTREFGERGRDDWAVHVALAHGTRLVAGAVALPARDTVLSTMHLPRRPARGDGRMRIAVSRSRPPTFVDTLAASVGATTVPMGSAGAKIAAVVLGDVEAYVHAGGQYEWDSAAPVAVAQAVGLHTSRLDGAPLVYNQPEPWLPDLLVCHPDCAEALLEALDDVEGT